MELSVYICNGRPAGFFIYKYSFCIARPVVSLKVFSHRGNSACANARRRLKCFDSSHRSDSTSRSHDNHFCFWIYALSKHEHTDEGDQRLAMPQLCSPQLDGSSVIMKHQVRPAPSVSAAVRSVGQSILG